MIKPQIVESKRTQRIRQLVDLTEGIDWLISKEDNKLALEFTEKLEQELFALYLEATQTLDKIRARKEVI